MSAPTWRRQARVKINGTNAVAATVQCHEQNVTGPQDPKPYISTRRKHAAERLTKSPAPGRSATCDGPNNGDLDTTKR